MLMSSDRAMKTDIPQARNSAFEPKAAPKYKKGIPVD